MRILVDNSFSPVDLNAGTIQNTSALHSIEISNTNQPDSGYLLFPGKAVTFSGSPVFVRTVDSNAQSNVVVVPLLIAELSNRSTANLATDDETNAMLDDILKG